MNIFTKILKGYSDVLKSANKSIKTFFKIVSFILFVLILSIAVVYPLWYLAENHATTYSIFVILLLLFFILFYIVFKFVSISKELGFKFFLKNIVVPQLKKIFFVIIFILSVLATIFIYSYNLLLGFVVTIIILIIIGFYKFVVKV